MKTPRRRREGMNQTLAAPAEAAPSNADRGESSGLAFEELYRSSRDDIFAYVAGLLRDRSAAEDVTAAAFERAYRKQARFDPQKGEPRAWIFGIARNAALDELRRRGRQAEMTAEPEDLAAVPAVESAEQSERRMALNAGLATLAPRDRELIALKFFAGLANAEIASVLGIGESNAGTRLNRALTKLREACDEAL